MALVKPVMAPAAVEVPVLGRHQSDIIVVSVIGKLICSSGSTVVVASVSSPYGLYSQLGWYSGPSSGYLLGGSQTTSSQMSLTYCASFCGGTPYFAVENGGFSSHYKPKPP